MSFAKDRSRYCLLSVMLGIAVVALFTAGLAATSSSGQAGDGWCGTVVSPEQTKMEMLWDHTRTESDRHVESTTRYAIPAAFHIVRTSAGTGGLDLARLDSAIDISNANLEHVNVQLYEYGPVDYINSDLFYYHLGENSEFRFIMMGMNRAEEAVNVYLVPPDCGVGFCGLSTYPTSSVTQGIVVRNDCLVSNGTATVLAHELGHYFNLFHPHEIYYGIECPDGSNCADAGDLICDTPADPYLGGHVSGPPECEYDHYADPPESCDDTPYDPLTDNLMSYTHHECPQVLTPQQIEKFRYTLENMRPELATTAGGLLAYPGVVGLGAVPLGGIAETSLGLTWIFDDSVEIQSVTSSLGSVGIQGSLPVTIGREDTAAFVVSFDASSLTDPCDRGVYIDTVVFTTTDPDNPELRIPVSVTLGGSTAAVETADLATTCLDVSMNNVAAISEFALSSEDALLEASLMLGLMDGADTIVYRNIFGVNGFTPFDIISGTDSSRSYELLTDDNRLQGRVTVAFDPSDPNNCDFVKLNYELYNPCDTPLSLLSGLLADFDLGSNPDDYAGFDDTLNLAYITNSDNTRACGMALLDTEARNLRAVNVSTEVSGGFSDAAAYAHLESTANAEGSFAEDWAALVTFGENLLAPGDTARYTVLLMYSQTGSSGLPDIYTKAAFTTCCIPPTVGDVDQSGAVDITDVSVLIDNQFLTLTPLVCEVEGDVDFSGVVDITDLSVIIDNQFISLTPLPPCP